MLSFFIHYAMLLEVYFMEHSRKKIPSKILIYSTIMYSVGFLLFSIGFFINLTSLSWALGWLLGAMIATFNYASIIFQATRLQARINAKITTPYRGTGYALARLVLSALGMLACVLIEINNDEVFNLFTLFAAYLVISGIIFVTGSQFQPVRKSI
jgi:uncharacterized membrane protein YiaA